MSKHTKGPWTWGKDCKGLYAGQWQSTPVLEYAEHEGNGPPISPDYCNDLNAMHEAIDSLDQESAWRMIMEVTGYRPAIKEFPAMSRLRALRLLKASPKELAEAFLRTVGKWEDGQ